MKYPIKYFCGPGLSRYHPKLIERGLKMFNDSFEPKGEITGETGIEDLKLDFNCGLRLQIPRGNWHARITDSNGVIFFDGDVERVTLISMEKYYIEWEIALWLDGEPAFYHQFDPRGQKVHFNFAQPLLGDNVAMLPYAEAFRRAFDCEVTCKVFDVFDGILENYYPQLRPSKALPDDSYACYYFSGWMNLPIATPADMRSMPMELFGRAILNTPKIRPSKIIYRPTKPRLIKEKYVCIAVQASYTPKCWFAPDGWEQVINHLKALGYRVLCIDKNRKSTNYGLTVEMPEGVEDLSGNYNLIDRVNQLAYADFFIGLSSGLSWLAWAVDIPVVMISGITEYWYEFETAYRVSNQTVCHGCFNSLAVDPLKILDCPKYKGTDRAYECSKSISARQVIDAVDQLIADNRLGVRHETV